MSLPSLREQTHLTAEMGFYKLQFMKLSLKCEDIDVYAQINDAFTPDAKQRFTNRNSHNFYCGIIFSLLRNIRMRPK